MHGPYSLVPRSHPVISAYFMDRCNEDNINTQSTIYSYCSLILKLDRRLRGTNLRPQCLSKNFRSKVGGTLYAMGACYSVPSKTCICTFSIHYSPQNRYFHLLCHNLTKEQDTLLLFPECVIKNKGEQQVCKHLNVLHVH